MEEFPKYYGGLETESLWQKRWEEEGIYRFDPDSSKPVYSIDTPPPTVSGQIHIGHVFSYTQAEIMIRYFRMKGFNIFYPFGFDDNGLPTERFVEKQLGVSAASLPREEFISQCLEISKNIEAQFKELWQSLGFSVDWDQLYSTIEPSSRRISQRSFLDLYKKGLVQKKAMPALYCPFCRTTVAQAESEDKEIPSQFVDLLFHLDDGRELIIATTRPELLPALVAVFIHPDDPRYKELHGHSVRSPLFDREVPLLTDGKVDPEKGTGAVMCCTFGDTTDIEWFNTHSLPLRQVIDGAGRLNELAGPYQGLKVIEARTKIKDDLEAAGLLRGRKEIVHSVNVHERCGKEIEFLVKDQWFIKILDKKEELIAQGDKIHWFPDFMKERYVNWVKDLKWDWCISRQRKYGVPFPLWYCKSCGQVVLAKEEELPVDPLQTLPKDPCPHCGGREFLPEADVMDTWATSSVTPQINGRWGEGDDRLEKIFPMSLRPQAHDIIRTWAFYTIVKSYYHHGQAPWKNIMISGHSLAQNREKISKSKGNAGVTPAQIIKNNTADTVRYWAAGSRLGMDTFFSEEVLKNGKRLITKLWNASKFALMNLENYRPGTTGKRNLIDLWILARLDQLVEGTTQYMEKYEYGLALSTLETFFWKDLCDNYIELVKGKIKEGTEEERIGSQEVLYKVLWTTLRLFAPFLPHVTEEIYSLSLKENEKHRSIHLAPWPENEGFCLTGEDEKKSLFLLRLVDAIRKGKTEKKLSLAHPIALFRFSSPWPREDSQIREALPTIFSLLKVQEEAERFEPDYTFQEEGLSLAIKWGEKEEKAPDQQRPL